MARFFRPDTTSIFGETDRSGAALEELLSNTNNNRRGSSNYWLGDLLNALFPWGTSARELDASRGPRQSRFAPTRVDGASIGAKPLPGIRYIQPPTLRQIGASKNIPTRMANTVSGLAPGGSTPIRYRYDANGGKIDLYGRPINNFGNIVAGNDRLGYIPGDRNTQSYRPLPGASFARPYANEKPSRGLGVR